MTDQEVENLVNELLNPPNWEDSEDNEKEIERIINEVIITEPKEEGTINNSLLQAMIKLGRKIIKGAAQEPEAVGILHPTNQTMMIAPMSILPILYKINKENEEIEQDAVWCWADFNELKDLKANTYEGSNEFLHHFALPIFCPPKQEDVFTSTASLVTVTWDDDCSPWTNLGEKGPWSI